MSRHLGLLKEAGLVSEEREGGFTYYRPAPALTDAQNGFGPLAAMLRGAVRRRPAKTASGRADDARLQEVLRLRKENFDAHAGPDTQARQLVPGRSWAAWSRALGLLLPPLEGRRPRLRRRLPDDRGRRWATRVHRRRSLADGAAPGAGAGRRAGASGT